MGKHGQDAKSFYEVHVTEPGLLHLSQSLGRRVFGLAEQTVLVRRCC